ncbi:LRR and NB-ARC domain disease resistance protein, partial [Trifolium medium]|nr:LRR and NB-ARC domain disease resistance protein [Trifolium medium]
MILTSTFLHKLDLDGIPSLTSFPADGLPTSLKSLVIVDCVNLEFLPPKTWSNYTSLVTLELQNSCDGLVSHWMVSLHSKNFPLTIALISLPQRMETLTTLQSLYIYDCDALGSLPGLDTLTSLKRLSLDSPQELMLSFSEGHCLPSNLQSIVIESMRITMPPMTEWGLQRLNALSRLTIGGDDDMVNTLLKEPLLPISLVHLSISNLSATKSLEGNGLRHLSSLETLSFSDCSELESLSKDMFPSTLKSLSFGDCSALESLSEDTLPS